ncbi:MAG: hypothetical protein WDW36_001730 [Sanguina aurantia]
MHRLSVAACLP